MAGRETFLESLTELSREALIERVLELKTQLAEAQAQIAELRRQLFGSKAEKLSPDEQAQMDELASDLQQEAQQPPPLSHQVLEEERRDQRRRRAERRPVRHPVPPVLETETVTLEPAAEEKLCSHCGREKQRIGEEVTEETDLVPAKLIRRRTVRPKYACRCGEAGVVIAPLPPRLIPQSKLGLGLAVHLLLARYDDHLAFYTLERKDAALHRIACLAHSRRWCYQALKESLPEAVWFIRQMRQLYRLEDQLRAIDPAARNRLRHEQAPAIWEAMKQHAETLQSKLLPKTTLGKAVNYFLNEYGALIGYLADGRFEIDNNLVENDIRPTAVGRKRWLFIGHPEAGWRSAVIYSILISCRRRGLNPQDYLTDVMARLPTAKITQIHDLLPGHWKPSAGNAANSSDSGV